MKTYKRPCDSCGRTVVIEANKDPEDPCFCKYCKDDFRILRGQHRMATEDEY